MKTMKSFGGLTRGRGITESVLTRWTLGMVYLQNICTDVESYCDVTTATSEQHIDMRPSRLTRDEEDAQKLRNWFSHHPPFPKTDFIMSLSSGLVGSEAVNCHNALHIGKEIMLKLIGDNFEQVKFTRRNTVKTLSSAVCSVSIGERKVTVNPLTLFHRLCILKESDEELKEFFTHELSPFPMSLFTEEGMRKSTKSSFYAAFTPVSLDEIQGKATYVVVDGGHLLHKVVWPRSASFGTIAAKYIQYLKTHYGSNVAVVFDGYPSDAAQKNTKSSERVRRSRAISSPDVIFDESTIAPVAQDKFLSNERNKVRFIDMLKVHLERSKMLVLQADEDADRLIVTTAISMASAYDVVKIAGEDIDLLVLLCGLTRVASDAADHALSTNRQVPEQNIFFEKCGRGKNADVMYSTISFMHGAQPGLELFLHAFSGCDTTSTLFGQGKMKFLSTLKKQPHLEENAAVFLDPNATPEQVAEAGESFLVSLYGGNYKTQNLNDLRFQLFARAAAKTNFNLARLPPTQDAARFHSLRTHNQVKFLFFFQLLIFILLHTTLLISTDTVHTTSSLLFCFITLFFWSHKFVIWFVSGAEVVGSGEESPRLGLDAQLSWPHSTAHDERTSPSTPVEDDFLQL